MCYEIYKMKNFLISSLFTQNNTNNRRKRNTSIQHMEDIRKSFKINLYIIFLNKTFWNFKNNTKINLKSIVDLSRKSEIRIFSLIHSEQKDVVISLNSYIKSILNFCQFTKKYETSQKTFKYRRYSIPMSRS